MKELEEAKKHNGNLLRWLESQDLKDRQETEEEARERAGTYEIFWRVHFEKDLAIIVQQQLQFMGQNVETEAQLLWLRGVLAGLDIVKKKFEEKVNLSMSRFNT